MICDFLGFRFILLIEKKETDASVSFFLIIYFFEEKITGK